MALEASLGCESNINSLNKEITEAAQKSAREASRPAERGRMTGACGSWQQLCPISFLPVNSARKPVRDPQRGEGGRSGKATGREQSPGAAWLHGEAARRPQNVRGWDVGVGSWASPTAAAAGVAPASEGATEQGRGHDGGGGGGGEGPTGSAPWQGQLGHTWGHADPRARWALHSPDGSALPWAQCCGTPSSPRCFQAGAVVRTERPKSTLSSKGPSAVSCSPREGEGAALQGSGQQIFPSQRISQE